MGYESKLYVVKELPYVRSWDNSNKLAIDVLAVFDMRKCIDLCTIFTKEADGSLFDYVETYDEIKDEFSIKYAEVKEDSYGDMIKSATPNDVAIKLLQIWQESGYERAYYAAMAIIHYGTADFGDDSRVMVYHYGY